MKFTDTHAHLYYTDEYASDAATLMRLALQQGVDRIYLPNVDIDTLEPMFALVKSYPDNCFPMVGLHPCYVKEDYLEKLAAMLPLLEQQEVVAVGEVGIDLYHDITYFEQQKLALQLQAQWSLDKHLPLIIHCRDSFDETVEVLSAFKGLKGIFHCFGGTLDEARKVIDMGFLLGIGGVVTYKKSELDQVLPFVGLENIVLETDSPYLAPVPYRGKVNTPANIPLIAEKVAAIMQVSLKKVADTTNENAENLFLRMRSH